MCSVLHARAHRLIPVFLAVEVDCARFALFAGFLGVDRHLDFLSELDALHCHFCERQVDDDELRFGCIGVPCFWARAVDDEHRESAVLGIIVLAELGGDLRIAQTVEAVVWIGNFVAILCFIDQGIFSLGDNGDIFDAVAVEVAERSRYAGDGCEFTSKLLLNERIVDSGRGRDSSRRWRMARSSVAQAVTVHRPRGSSMRCSIGSC